MLSLAFSRRARRAAWLPAALLLAALAAARTGAQNGGGWTRLPGHVPSPRFIAREAGAVAPGERVDLALTLPLRHPDELQGLLARLYNPDDPLYGQFLTPAEFADRFAPTEAQYRAVAAYTRA